MIGFRAISMASADQSFNLPPKPDPYTGEPRPPHAPAYRGDDDDNAKTRETSPSRKPEAPPNQGPVLAWYQATKRHAWSVFFWGVGIIVVGAMLVSWLRSGGNPLVGFFQYWEPWVAVVVFAAPLGLSVRKDKCSAGAEWVRGKSKWVRLYELTSIKVKYYGDGSTELHLDDRDGRHLEIDRKMLCSDQLIWDLVYNGILHSAVQGAEVDQKTQRALQLPVIPQA